MYRFSPSEAWKPGCVIMGQSITKTSTLDGNTVQLFMELREAGVVQDALRVRLIRSAHIATKAIAKMLVSEA